jgi:hypothetical protein
MRLSPKQALFLAEIADGRWYCWGSLLKRHWFGTKWWLQWTGRIARFPRINNHPSLRITEYGLRDLNAYLDTR